MSKKIQLTVEIDVDDSFDVSSLNNDVGTDVLKAIKPHIPIKSAGDLRVSGVSDLKAMQPMWAKTTCDVFGK
ncbi:MAG TPA: hypothetical protein VE092_01295 [Herbaspirillum sp.]|uniref:hypothetical protein n=1 Tax=Herbaspirillum sp. TaxID=1890675 RepID=UPI002D74F33F|nr:hypothetical protein [Herbaspirillum sp.]HZG18622.1 hypothetical protein [Herbaspirillum sp.]